MVTRIGALEPLQVMNILHDIELHEKTGELLIMQGNHRARLYFLQGKIVHTDFLSESMIGERLIQAGILSRQDLQTGLLAQKVKQNSLSAYNAQKDVSIVTALTDLGLVSNKQLHDLATKDITAILQDIFTWTTGEVSFDEGKVIPPDRLPIALRATSLIPAISSSSSNSNDTVTEGSKSLKEKPSISLRSQSSLFKVSEPKVEEKSGISSLNISDTTTKIRRIVKQKPAVSSVPVDGPTYKIAAVQKPRNFILRWETLVIVAILLIAALAHGINMFHYPYYEDDEGTYLSQGWAVLHLGRLAYYTYWYDHAPMGWIQIALWTAITGSFHVFSSAMDSGRTFMLILQIGSTFMLYRIARTISGSVTVAIIVALLFALSPYGLYYHRRVLLDNIMTFWMLLSILFLIVPHLSLKYIWFSGISLALSILSKEVTIFIIPVLAYLVWVRADKSHRVIAFLGWLTLVFTILSVYLLFATLKGELFPTGTLLGGSNPHVSLIGTLLFQGSRGKDGGLFDLHSSFWYRAIIWAQDDPIIVVGGSLCAIISVLLLRKHRIIGIIGLTTLSLWAFLARGGTVIDFYLVPLIPMCALTLGLILGLLAQYSKKYLVALVKKHLVFSRIIQPAIVILCLVSIVVVIPPPSSGVGYGAPNVGSKDNPFTYWNSKPVDAQIEAMVWIEGHIPLSSRVIIDMSMWPDLYSKGYKNVHYYWKLETDPAIRNGIFHNNWQNVDYIVTTPQMLLDMRIAHMSIVKSLLEHSTSVAVFDTGGWGIDIRKVHK